MSDAEKAKQFKQRAAKAVSNAVAAMKRLTPTEPLEEQERQWSAFLSEFRKALKFMSEAARNEGRNSWADNLLKERKENQTLTYLFHARNADEHGVLSGYAIAPGAVTIGNMFSFGGDSKNITISNCVEITRLPNGQTIKRRVDGNFSTSDGKITEGWLKSELPVESVRAHLSLGPIINRGQTYNLSPEQFRREDIAQAVAQKATNWLSKKLSELLSQE